MEEYMGEEIVCGGSFGLVEAGRNRGDTYKWEETYTNNGGQIQMGESAENVRKRFKCKQYSIININKKAYRIFISHFVSKNFIIKRYII